MNTDVLASFIMPFRCNSAAPLSVVPGQAGSHTPYHSEGAQPANNRDTRGYGPRLRGEDSREAMLPYSRSLPNCVAGAGRRQCHDGVVVNAAPEDAMQPFRLMALLTLVA